MSFSALAWAIKAPTKGPTERLVLVTLASYADDDGLCWPRQTTIRAATQLSERAIRSALASLCAHGLIEKQHRYVTSGFRRRSDIYHLHIAAGGAGMKRQEVPDKNSQSKNHHRGRGLADRNLSEGTSRSSSSKAKVVP